MRDCCTEAAYRLHEDEFYGADASWSSYHSPARSHPAECWKLREVIRQEVLKLELEGLDQGPKNEPIVRETAIEMKQVESSHARFETKDTNPKDAVGTAKVPFSTVSAPVMGEVGLAMLEGALKYGRHNYRVSGVRASVYYDAARRHLDSFWEGEDIDPDSGLPHIVKAIACMTVLRDSQIQGNWVDDRPPKTPDGWVQDLNGKAKALLEKYPDPVAAHTEI